MTQLWTFHHRAVNMLKALIQSLLRLFGYELRALPPREVELFRQHLIHRNLLRLRLLFAIKHLHGPKEIVYAKDELIVVCLVRDGEPFVEAFVKHYVTLGAKHIIFLDNGSVDATVEIARRHTNVTILQSTLPFDRYKLVMREYLMNRFGKGRWVLNVDIDELFVYPFADRLDLRAFLVYLNRQGYTAVVAHLLDMFPERPLSRLNGDYQTLKKDLHRWYDLNGVVRANYRITNNAISNVSIKRYFGGIRATVFGLERLNLTKHPLVFVDDHIQLLYNNSHDVNWAKIADITCVLLHYKFAGNFYKRAVRAVTEQNYHDESSEYRAYLRAFDQSPTLHLKQDSSMELQGVDDLVDQGFLVISEAYGQWLERCAAAHVTSVNPF